MVMVLRGVERQWERTEEGHSLTVHSMNPAGHVHIWQPTEIQWYYSISICYSSGTSFISHSGQQE